MTTRLTPSRTVTYRKAGIPAVILEGKWLERVFGWHIGDRISVHYEPSASTIVLKNVDKEIATDLGLAMQTPAEPIKKETPVREPLNH